MSEKRNQGEGNREAAREYNDSAEKHAKTADVGGLAQDAKKAVEGKEGPSLEEARKKGSAPAKEHDPLEKRDPTKPA